MSDPLKDPDGVPYPEEVQALVFQIHGIVTGYPDAKQDWQQALVEALESVRSMEHPPNVVKFYAYGESPQTNSLVATLLDAAENHLWFSVTVDRGALKIKAGAQSWSPPFTSEEQDT